MSLVNYFENVKGVGILGTADPEGKVDLATAGSFLLLAPQILHFARSVQSLP
jgi:hypothetical protein